MAKAGASFVVVMGRAHEATIRCVVDAGRDFGIQVMGDNMLADDRVANAPLAGVARRRRHHPPHRLRRAAAGQGPQPAGRTRRRWSPPSTSRCRPSAASPSRRRSSARRTARRWSCSARRWSSTPTTSSRAARISQHPARDLQRDPQDADGAARQRARSSSRSRSWAPRKPPSFSTRSSRSPVELREIPVPEIGDDDVLLQVGAVSVCGSDVHQCHATHSWPVNVPVVLGHEFGGTVAKAGRAVRGVQGRRSRRQRDGRRASAATCLMCRTGRYNLCPTRKGFGYGVNGAMASVRARAGALPARTSRTRCRSSIACLRRAARRRLPVDVRQLDDPARATWSSCSAPDRSACCARGWRRSPAPTR